MFAAFAKSAAVERPGTGALVLTAEQAKAHGVYVHASLYEHQPMADGRGLNVAIIVSPAGELVARTPKLHIPVTAGYYEDKYFTPGSADGEPYPVQVVDVEGCGTVRLGMPTCWDEWFPEEIGRAHV